MTSARDIDTPMEFNIKLNGEDGDPVMDKTNYQRLVGKLIYLSAISPYISYAVNKLSQFMQKPRKPHFAAIHRILRYLDKTKINKWFLLFCRRKFEELEE